MFISELILAFALFIFLFGICLALFSVNHDQDRPIFLSCMLLTGFVAIALGVLTGIDTDRSYANAIANGKAEVVIEATTVTVRPTGNDTTYTASLRQIVK